MGLSDFFHANQIRAERDELKRERDSLKAILSETERMQVYELKRAISDLEEKERQAKEGLAELEASAMKERQEADRQLEEIARQIVARKAELVELDEQVLLQSVGFYQSQYNLGSSEKYKKWLSDTRIAQSNMIKLGDAVKCLTPWTVNNSKVEGERMIRDYTKLILRAFNNECDASITAVKFSNVEATNRRITKAFDDLNKLGARMSISVTRDYLKLKLKELHLCYEYQVQKEAEKEEQRRIREEMKEEAKLLKEIEDLKERIAKEETHFTKALKAVDERMAAATLDADRELLRKEKEAIEGQLSTIEKNKQDVAYREQNTRAGYVYIISNIGSFGKDVFKIGVTRRLEPEERVNELGDASVPFKYDIHAMIFSDDAPKLESALHMAFDGRRLNLVNARREFFTVSLNEIESVVKANFQKPVEFVSLPEAAEYRQSESVRRSLVEGAKAETT